MRSNAVLGSKAAGSGLQNLVFRAAGAEDLPDDNRYDLVLTLDCLHDMPRPAQAAAAIRRAIRPDGTWLIKGHPGQRRPGRTTCATLSSP